MSGQSDSVTYARVPGSELLASATYGSGLTTTYGYEAGRDLKTQVRNTANGATVSQYDYAYDVVGRRTSVTNSGSAFAQSAFSRWTYNDRNELIESGRYAGTNVGDTSNPVAAEHRAYSFDPLGNRQTAIEGAQTKAYNTNALNEYASVDGASLSYDADGNLTNDGTRRFVYDGENRLVSVEPVATGNGSVRVKMAYDYLGRRVQKVVEEFDGSAWAAADDVRFVYVGWNVIEEWKSSAGVSTKKNFAWGLDLSQSMDGAGGIGGLLASVDESGSQMAFVFDANGNVGQLVDEAGGVVARYEYDAFGQTLVAAGAAANDNAYRFSTKPVDVETGLSYYGYRYYSASMGRWVNRDPIGERGGLSLSAFPTNNLIDRVDFLGQCVLSSCALDEKYLKRHLRTWLSLPISEGQYTTQYDGGDSSGGLEGLILSRMFRSPSTFRSADADGGPTRNIQKHVDARVRIVENIRSVRFAFGADQAKSVPQVGFTYYDDPQRYLQAVNQPSTRLACEEASVLVFFGALGTYGEGYATRP